MTHIQGKTIEMVCVAALCIFAMLLLVGSAPASAATEHTFDPFLSLRGDGLTDSTDEVPDPGLNHPPKRLDIPCGTATDQFGNIYVASPGATVEGRIDIFSPDGKYLTEIPDENGPCGLAVDSGGNIYVAEWGGRHDVVRFHPDTFPPASGTKYGPAEIFVEADAENCPAHSVAIDPSNDHLHVATDYCGLGNYKPDGTPDGINEVQRLAVNASSGTFNLALFGPAFAGGRNNYEAIALTADLSSGTRIVSSVVSAAGSGTLVSGSTEITALATEVGSFEVGREVAGAGILPGTKITELSRTATASFMRLSQPATASGTGVSLTTVGFPANAPGRLFGPGIPAGTTFVLNEKGQFELSAAATRSGSAVPLAVGSRPLQTGGSATGQLTAGSTTVTSVISATGTGDLTVGKSTIEDVTSASGAFHPGQTISGIGIPPETTVVAVDGAGLGLSKRASASGSGVELSAVAPFAKGESVTGPGIQAETTIDAVAPGSLVLSKPATSGGEAALQAAIPYDASATTVKASLEAIGAIGAGDVLVSEVADAYLIEFVGRMANLDVRQMGVEGAELTGIATLTTDVPGFNGYNPDLRESFSSGLVGLDVFGANHDVYVSGTEKGASPGDPEAARIFIYDGTDGHLKERIDGKGSPQQVAAGTGNPDGGFGFTGARAAVAVDQSNGDVYVGDLEGNAAVEQFAADGTFLAQLKHFFTAPTGATKGDIAIDSGLIGQSGYQSPNEGYIYVTSGNSLAKSHLYAFKPLNVSPPQIERQQALEITDTEARLSASLNPGGKPTAYHFEYISQADYEAEGDQFGAGTVSVPVPDTSAGDGGSFGAVSQPLTGLTPGATYRFRLVASNCESPGESECLTKGEGKPGEVGTDAAFSTYNSETDLLEGRAYELVTPADTNGRIPTITELGGAQAGSAFATQLSSPDGSSLIFGVEGGSIPELGGGGYHDTYEALRDPERGWQSHFNGISGPQAELPTPGGLSPDHGLAFWSVEGFNGTLAPGAGFNANYLRRPGGVLFPGCSPEPSGQFEFVGCGSLGNAPFAQGKWISPGGGHVIVAIETSNSGVEGVAKALEPCAHDGLSSVYDRTADGVTHCIAIPPENATPETEAEFEQVDADFQGVSADGAVVLFTVGPSLYARLDNEETVRVASAGSRLAGISNDGDRVIYLQNPTGDPPRGEIFSFDTAGREAMPVGAADDAILVNVSGDGSHVYFSSESALTPNTAVNDAGEYAEAAKQNLYVWSAQALSFIGQLRTSDVVGEAGPDAPKANGLGLWVGNAIRSEQFRLVGPAVDPSRTTADGSVFLFQSRARLTDFDNGGHSEVYRYDADAAKLSCVSCNPTGVPGQTDAELQSPTAGQLLAGSPLNAVTPAANLSADGSRAFFQSGDRLALADSDQKVDVYEWVAPGIGSCQVQAGCIHLISGGNSRSDDYLYAVTPTGSDVFFETADRLVAQDTSATPSIYDARVGGGFPTSSPPRAECLGEVCQPDAVAPIDPTPSSSTFQGPGDPRPRARCRKVRRKIHGKNRVRCARPHKRVRRHHGGRR